MPCRKSLSEEFIERMVKGREEGKRNPEEEEGEARINLPLQKSSEK